MSSHLTARTTHRVWLATATALLLATTVLALQCEGRSWWCACGRPPFWISEVKSSHCSQHFFDPYSFTHFLHGTGFAGLLTLTLPRLGRNGSWLAVLALEAAWEVLENSPFVIARYREGTAALGYTGDSIANSIGDIAACMLGWAVAKRLGWKRSIVIFITIELLLLAWIRDNLTLNIIMLLCPLDAIRQWQLK